MLVTKGLSTFVGFSIYIYIYMLRGHWHEISSNIRFFLFSLKMLVIKDLSTFPGFCMFMEESHWGELLSNIKGIFFLYHFQSNWWRLPAVGRQPGYLVHHESVTICQSVWSWGENFVKHEAILMLESKAKCPYKVMCTSGVGYQRFLYHRFIGPPSQLWWKWRVTVLTLLWLI